MIQVDNIDDETKNLLECLARDILKRPLHRRQNFLRMFEKEHGEQVTDILKLYITKEFNKQKAKKKQRQEEAARLKASLKS